METNVYNAVLEALSNKTSQEQLSARERAMLRGFSLIVDGEIVWGEIEDKTRTIQQLETNEGMHKW